MKNAYQRRRVKARVEKRARMMKLDAITLDFARQVIEEETGAPLDIQAGVPDARTVRVGVEAPAAGVTQPAGAAGAEQARAGGEARLIARDERKNPLISTFEWTGDAAQRILRVPAGFMRNKTQERIEELALERAATTIDLPLVEDGIEIGKQMMAEMMATYSAPAPSAGASAAGAGAGRGGATSTAAAGAPAQDTPAGAGGGYLNEVRSR